MEFNKIPKSYPGENAAPQLRIHHQDIFAKPPPYSLAELPFNDDLTDDMAYIELTSYIGNQDSNIRRIFGESDKNYFELIELNITSKASVVYYTIFQLIIITQLTKFSQIRSPHLVSILPHLS